MRIRARATVTMNRAAIRSVFRDDDGPVGRELDDLSRRVMTVAQQRVGVRSGLLLRTIRREKGQTGDGPYADVIAGRDGLTPYLMYHHDGTRPHVIRPRRKSALRFTVGGQVVFARSVNHPGTAPNRFLLDALDTI